MSTLRRFVSTLVSALVLAAALAVPATPALAASTSSSSGGGVGIYEHDSDNMPVLLDLMVVRPAGLAVLVAGTALMVPVGAFTLMTRPSNIDVPFEALMKSPAEFVFVDPVGSH